MLKINRHSKYIFNALFFLLFGFVFFAAVYNHSIATSSQHQAYVNRLNDIEQQQLLLSKLNKEIGYGGLIHHYANLLVFEPTNARLKQLQKNFEELDRLLEQLANYDKPANEDIAYQAVTAVIEKYRQSYQSISQNQSSNINTSIDDSEALEALDTLEQGLLTRHFQTTQIAEELNRKVNLQQFISGLFLLSGIGLAWITVNKYRDRKRNHFLISSQLKEIIDAAKVGVWEVDMQTGEGSWSDVTAKIHEVSPGKQVNPDKGLEFYKEGDSRETITKVFSRAMEYGETYDVELPIVTAKGNEKWIRTVGIPVSKNGKVVKLYGTFQDISKRKHVELKLDKANEELLKLTYLDALTKISNRRCFDDTLIKEIHSAERSKKPLSLLMIDIDRFKSYNDKYGHQQGDDALYKVASAIKSSLARKMDIACRYGGEEFTVLLPDTDLIGAESVAVKVLQNVKALNIEHEGSEFQCVTVSIGVTSTKTAFEQLLPVADQQLYKAKEAGRNIHRSFLIQ